MDTDLPQRLLLALADLAPGPTGPELDVSRGGALPLYWVDDSAARLPAADPTVRKLAATDRLHESERLLRWGEPFLHGRLADRSVRLPLRSTPVRLVRGLGGLRMEPAGDVELNPLITDPYAIGYLEAHQVDGSWIEVAAEALGMTVGAVLARREGLHNGRLRLDDAEKLTGITAGALYVARDPASPNLGAALRGWAARPDLEQTALARVYGISTPTAAAPDEDEIRSPLPLNAAQREVVRRARTEPVTVLSGPPGNGKSHTVVAAAVDAVDRGLSVLVATRSHYAADVLATLLAQQPGPPPVLFGDAEKRSAFAAAIADGTPAGTTGAELAAAEHRTAEAVRVVSDLEYGLTAELDRLRRADRAASWGPRLPALTADVPGTADPCLDLAGAEDLLAAARAPATGWWRRRKQRKAEEKLRGLLRTTADHARIRTALDAAADVRAAAELAARGVPDLAWDALHRADAELAAAVGAEIGVRAASSSRWKGDGRKAVAALGTALRSGRARRRQALAGLDGESLVRALPLWIGTVADVEDLLPATPGLFDLVILDEAAHIDQLRAAPVLARARRAVIAGDPRQLRFVSFTADARVAEVLAEHDLAALADRLDVRRAGAFDVAAGAAPATWLTEHHRCAPHLIGFSADRFYAGRIELMTRHPRTDGLDLIDVRRSWASERLKDGAVPGEVLDVVAYVRELQQRGERDVAVVSPFRGQADAIDAALAEAFTLEEIEALRLRSGTVHAFQGSEADHVVVSLGLVDADSASRRRFADEPHLFNVLVTRARQRVTVVSALTAPDGLLGEYLGYGEHPPPPPRGDADAVGWTAELAAELARAGRQIHSGYRVGRWTVDLVLGETGILTGVHPDGPAAHLERARTLTRAGWRLTEAFAPRWNGDAARAALELAGPASVRECPA